MRRFVLAVAVVLASTPTLVVAQPGDWGVTRDPFDPQVIGRYKAILKSNPHDASALANLLKAYRQHRTLDLLKDEYQKALDRSPDDWSTLVVMGRLQHTTGDDARALDLWTKAVSKKDDDSLTWLDIGEMQKQAGKNKEARAAYDKSLAHASAKDIKRKALRALADLALATNDFDAANDYFKQFLDLDPTNAQLWIERGDAMLAAGKRDVALDSYAAAEKLLGSDPARRVEVVARRGRSFEEMGKQDEAVAEYRRAIKLAPKGYYIDLELIGRIIDIYRKKNGLPALLAQYEKEWPDGSRGHLEWSTLGKLYEETGAQDKAIAALKRAVAVSPWELETQRHLIQLLRNSGRDDEVLAQYEAVVRAAPGQQRFQIELAETYWGRGAEKKALDVLVHLEARFPSDPGVLQAIAELYQRWGKDELAIAQFERLAKIEPDDPEHLRTLGDQYWQKNDKARAEATWKRIISNGKASSFAKYGEVLAEHQKLDDARASYDKAISIDPKNPEWLKGRAGIFEQKKNYKEAANDWKLALELIGGKPQDRIARRDARRRYVQLIARTGIDETTKRNEWESKFTGANPDIEAGYFLIEYYAKKNKPTELLATLRTMHSRVADDQDVWMDLVKVLKQTRKFDEAIELLKDLAKTVPSREREAYTMIAEIMTEARRDNEAIVWAQKALDKSPNNPQAYEALGERYVDMQRFADAIDAYEKALKLSPTNSKASFALSELYVQTGVPMKAAELLRGVLRSSTDEETVAKAADKAIDLEEMTDTLGELEKVLSPLSFMMAHKPVYRRVLVNLYVRYVPRLVERLRHGNDEVKKAAKIELDRIGAHGLRPLLEALRDEKDTSQQRVAVGVLGHLGNKSAAAPLVHMARQEPPKDTTRRIGTLTEGVDHEVRIDALVAAGRLGDPAVLADVLPLMDAPELAMRAAATFALGRSGDRRAVAPLLKALGDRKAPVQALACLGLAQVDDPRVGPALVAKLADTRTEDTTRGACAYAIGARRIASAVPTLLATLADNRGEAQRLSAWALGQIGEPRALGPLIRAYFARAGRSADELVWAIGRTGSGGLALSPLGDLGEYPTRGGMFDPAPALAQLPVTLPHGTATTKIVVEHTDDIIAGLKEALGQHRDVVVSALADLDAAPSALSLGALTGPAGPESSTPGSATRGNSDKLATPLQTIAVGIEPAVVAQLGNDDPKVRALALSVLAKMDGGKVTSADAAIAKAMTDSADQVRASAMTAITVLAKRRGSPPPALVTALAKALGAGNWGDRRVAAIAMGQLGAKADAQALVKAAGDGSSFVREATATALGQVGGATVVEPLLALSKDDVIQVRAAAARALGRFDDARAQKRRAELAKDPDPSVREAAGEPAKSTSP